MRSETETATKVSEREPLYLQRKNRKPIRFTMQEIAKIHDDDKPQTAEAIRDCEARYWMTAVNEKVNTLEYM